MNKRRSAWIYFLITLLLCVVLLGLLLGTTLARYEKNTTQVLQFQYGAGSEQVYITKIDDVHITGDAVTMNVGGNAEAENSTADDNAFGEAKSIYVMDFLLSNGTGEDDYCTADQKTNLTLFATIGVGNPEEFTITLTDGVNTYVAAFEETVEGTAMYELYGPGWVYRFYNASGEEVSWQFYGNHYSSRHLTITVEGTCELPTALSLIAETRPGEV